MGDGELVVRFDNQLTDYSGLSDIKKSGKHLTMLVRSDAQTVRAAAGHLS